MRWAISSSQPLEKIAHQLLPVGKIFLPRGGEGNAPPPTTSAGSRKFRGLSPHVLKTIIEFFGIIYSIYEADETAEAKAGFLGLAALEK